mmetsp:Transcript_18967/g.52914  ORF Transcript_18967/g.52914 Transcript_18967/m.52914 type:complete len:984 (-) Transcript_18967:48-2999(-)
MWSNLAKGLNSTDINATLQKIGNVVAPPEDDDSDFEYYDEDGDGDYLELDEEEENEEHFDEDDGYEEDHEFNEDEGGGHGKGIIEKVANVTPFRLAGMLTRALDDRQPGIQNEDYHENKSLGNEVHSVESNHNDEETENKMDRVLFPKESNGIDEYEVDKGRSPTEVSHEIHISTDKVVGEKNQRIADDGIKMNSKTKPAETVAEIVSKGNIQSKQLTEQSVAEKLEGTAKKSVNTSDATDILLQNEIKEKADTVPIIALTSATEKEIKSSTRKEIQIGGRKAIDDATKENSLATNVTTVYSRREVQQSIDKEAPHSLKPSTLNTARSDFGTKERNVVLSPDDTDITVNTHTTDVQNTTEKAASTAPINHYSRKEVKQVATNESISSEADLNAYSNEHDEVGKFNATNQHEDENNNNDLVGAGNILQTVSDKEENVDLDAPSLPLSKDHEILLDAVDGKRAAQNHAERSKKQMQGEDNPPRAKDSDKKTKSDYIQLLHKLEVAHKEIETLRNEARLEKEKAESEKEDLISQFHSKEVRLLQATSEENQNQTLILQQEYSAKIQHLEQLIEKERRESKDEQAEYKKLLRESYANIDRTESQLKAAVNKYENDIAQAKKQEERALRKVDDRMAQTMAVLDERDEEISRLKKSIRNMESKLSEHKEGEEEAEEELDELHHENETLRETIENLQLEKTKLKEQIEALKSGSEELSGLQMELTMLKEERARERTKNQAAVDSALVSRTQIESERDSALSQLKDSKQQLAAALGDLEIAHSDNARMMTANDNLQSALEAFQDERRAEMEMVDEQRRESEDAIKSAHATATNALKQIHETQMYEFQKASDSAVKNMMQEMELVQGTVEKLKSEKNQIRRSLDEAIHRLQTTQEDIIDRNVMKNILVDWCTLNDKSKRHQVLEVMANLLHFSEEEKEKVHLTSKSLDSVRAKVVGALAAPLPPSKADVEHLEGSNVHEKFINFLMAETDDI